MKLLWLFGALSLTACGSSCRWKHMEGRGQVTSTGYGEIKVAPDMVQFSVDIAFTRPAIQEAMDEAQKAADQVLDACRKVIPDSNDVKVLRVSANKDMEWVNGANVFKGYAASQTVEVTLRDLSKMEKLTRGILEAPVSGLGGFAFNHSKADSLRSEANALAMLDAQKNVRKMCRAVDQSCEVLVSARTAVAPNYAPMFAAAATDLQEAKTSPRGISVKPGLMSFSATVEATYGEK